MFKLIVWQRLCTSRLANRHASTTRRALSTSSVRKGQRLASHSRRWALTLCSVVADLVQDIYLRQLRDYKPAPVKPNDAEGHVQNFTAPRAPKSPEESSIASELKAYEEQQVEVEGQSQGEAAPSEYDWFEKPESMEEEEHH